MRIAICDGDPVFLEETASLLRTWGDELPGFSVDCFASGKTLVKAHTRLPYDVILLGILMPALDGIEIAREIRALGNEVKIVFAASSPDHAVESYSVKATNYLLKPIDPATLLRCFDEIEEELRTFGRAISFRGVWSAHRASVASIEFIKALGKHVEVNFVDGEVITSNDPLYAFEERLGIADGFYKCHRSHYVNINHIRTYAIDEIIMRSGHRIPVSRNCRAEFKEAYFSVMFGDEADGGKA